MVNHKTDSPGLGYELAVLIHSSQIAWTNGPFMASSHDGSICLGRAKKLGADGKLSDEKYECLFDKIPDGKRGIADQLYKGDVREKISVRNELDLQQARRFKKRVRARHENVNARLKAFKILSDRFRHSIKKHQMVFEAVCVIVQYDMDNGHPLMDV